MFVLEEVDKKEKLESLILARIVIGLITIFVTVMLAWKNWHLSKGRSKYVASRLHLPVKAVFGREALPNFVIDVEPQETIPCSETDVKDLFQKIMSRNCVSDVDAKSIMNYVSTNNIDGPSLGVLAMEAKQFELAFAIFKSLKMHLQAILVLLNDIKCLRRAVEYANEVDEDVVWNELIYVSAKMGRLSDIEKFLPNVANPSVLGDELCAEALYEAAKVIFAFIPDFKKLILIFLELRQFQGAVDAARKANHSEIWLKVFFACADANEFSLAQMCGLNLITEADHLKRISMYYQTNGRVDELISFMESCVVGHDNIGVATELGVLYAKYRHPKLMGYILRSSTRVDIPKLIKASRRKRHWKELVCLYILSNKYDGATRTILAHTSKAWEHMLFKYVLLKARDTKLHYKAIQFYLEEHSDLVGDLVFELGPLVDVQRISEMAQVCGLNLVTKADHLKRISVYYQTNGRVDELISFLERHVVGHDNLGVFTELGVLYAKYRQPELMGYILTYSTKVDIPKLIKVSRRKRHWKEVVCLYILSNKYDSATRTILDHTSKAWEHVLFKYVLSKSRDTKLYYRAVQFYLDEHSDLVEDVVLELGTIVNVQFMSEMLQKVRSSNRPIEY